jgi:toxin-antitoxin system PIN domain toxin
VSYSVDANMLLYASDRSSPVHAQALDFLSQRAADRETRFWLAWPTIMAYLRVSTHPKIFESPLKPAEAEKNIDSLLQLPQVGLLSEDDRFWQTYQRVASERTIRGNLVPDAYLAALLLHHSVKTLYTRDRDFLEFTFLEVLNPFTTSISSAS